MESRLIRFAIQDLVAGGSSGFKEMSNCTSIYICCHILKVNDLSHHIAYDNGL